MGYEMNVSDCSLTKTKPDFIHTDSMCMFEEWEDVGNEIDFTSNFYVASATDELLEDLNDFQGMGVRGHFTVYGEQGEWTKYVLDDEGIKELNPTLLWGDEAEIPRKGTMWEQVYTFMDKLALAGKGHEYLKYYIKHVEFMISPYFIGNLDASIILHLVDSVWFWNE